MPSAGGTVATTILDYVIARGARYIFVGPATNHQMPFLDALYDRRDQLTPILVRHEAMAPFMADGWFRATGSPGVFHVGTGPGLGNAVNGMMSAYASGRGIVGISGQVDTEFWGRNGMQEMQGITYAQGHRIVESVVKGIWQITNPRKTLEVMNYAWTAATTGRPGPVLVDVPMDVFALPCDVDASALAANHGPEGRLAGDPGVVSRALDLLVSAERPVLLCGGGVLASRASQALKEFAEWLALPVVTTYAGKGTIPDDHPLSGGPLGTLGTPGAMNLVRDADVIAALGTRLDEHTTFGWRAGKPFSIPPAKLIQVDVNVDSIGRYYPVAAGIQGDIEQILRQWLELAASGGVERRDFQASARTRELASQRKRHREAFQVQSLTPSSVVRPERVVIALREALPRDAFLLPDAGLHALFFHGNWDVFVPNTYILERGNATMGYGPAAALAVKLAHPDREVVVVTGDGCMTQANAVLATAAEYGLPVKYVVFNDSRLAGCSSLQQQLYGRTLCTEFKYDRSGETYVQNFALMAESYNVASTRIERSEDLVGAIKAMQEHEGPYLLEVRIDPAAEPVGAGVGRQP